MRTRRWVCTYPAADNPAGLDLATVPVSWSYSQADGYVQTQRRVRILRHADGVVLHDTGMQATASSTYTTPTLPSDVEVRVEVSIVTNAPGTPTVGPASRRLTSSYASPMAPEVTLEQGEGCIVVAIVNPAPTGSRPDVELNVIERREAGGDFAQIGTSPPDEPYLDYSVASRAQYDYRVIGVEP